MKVTDRVGKGRKGERGYGWEKKGLWEKGKPCWWEDECKRALREEVIAAGSEEKK